MDHVAKLPVYTNENAVSQKSGNIVHMGLFSEYIQSTKKNHQYMQIYSLASLLQLQYGCALTSIVFSINKYYQKYQHFLLLSFFFLQYAIFNVVLFVSTSTNTWTLT